MKQLLLSIVLLLLHITATAQDTKVDPIRNFRRVSNVGLAIGMSQLTSKSAAIPPGQGFSIYEVPSFGFGGPINFGWNLSYGKERHPLLLKTGVDVVALQFQLTKDGDRYRYSELRHTIPVMLTQRLPFYRAPGKNKYNALEFTFGPGVTFSYEPTIGIRGERPVIEDKSVLPRNISLTYCGDISFSSLDSNGKGDVFGLKTYIDFLSLYSIKDDIFNEQPLFIYSGIYYNLTNRAWNPKKRSN